jgi:hypothetical protein
MRVSQLSITEKDKNNYCSNRENYACHPYPQITEFDRVRTKVKMESARRPKNHVAAAAKRTESRNSMQHRTTVAGVRSGGYIRLVAALHHRVESRHRGAKSLRGRPTRCSDMETDTRRFKSSATCTLTKGVFTRIRRRGSRCPSKGIRRLIGH